MTAQHKGPNFRDCPACEEAAQAIAHLFPPESDVGPFDGACVLCRHLHDGDVCPNLGAVSERDAALEEAARIADEHWPEAGHIPTHGAVSCAMSISVMIRRLKSTHPAEVES